MSEILTATRLKNLLKTLNEHRQVIRVKSGVFNLQVEVSINLISVQCKS